MEKLKKYIEMKDFSSHYCIDLDLDLDIVFLGASPLKTKLEFVLLKMAFGKLVE